MIYRQIRFWRRRLSPVKGAIRVKIPNIPRRNATTVMCTVYTAKSLRAAFSVGKVYSEDILPKFRSCVHEMRLVGRSIWNKTVERLVRFSYFAYKVVIFATILL